MLGMPGLPYCLNTAYNLLIIKSDIILLLVTKLRLREIGSWSLGTSTTTTETFEVFNNFQNMSDSNAVKLSASCLKNWSAIASAIACKNS